LLRCSQPLSNKQTPHPTTKTGQHHQPGHRPRQHGVVSGPNSVLSDSAALSKRRFVVAHPAATHYRCCDSSRLTPPQRECFRGAP
jgi:hypothetical protein